MLSLRKALSSVVSTIILLGICISVAVAAGFYLRGILVGQTDYEVFEIVSTSCKLNGSYWVIDVNVKNVGSDSGTLVQALINGITVDNYESPHIVDQWSTSMSQTQLLRSGESINIKFFLDPDKVGTKLSSGTSIELMLHSAGGYDYPVLILLI